MNVLASQLAFYNISKGKCVVFEKKLLSEHHRVDFFCKNHKMYYISAKLTGHFKDIITYSFQKNDKNFFLTFCRKNKGRVGHLVPKKQKI